MKHVIRRTLLSIVVVVCVAGFLHDVVTWVRAGDRNVGDVLQQYWWAILFLVSFAVEALVKYARGSGGGPSGGSSG